MVTLAEQDCIFCKIGRGEISSEFLYRDDSAYVIRDIRPQAPVHLLVVPFAHVEALASEPQDRVEAMGRLLSVAVQVARQQGVDAAGYRLIVNEGPDSGQEVPHAHLHLLAGRPLGPLG